MDNDNGKAKSNGDEMTNIEVIVFEDENGLEIEMEILDEFDFQGRSIMALRPIPSEVDFDSEDETIDFFEIGCDDHTGEEIFELIEDRELISKLEDALENRLMNQQEN